MKFSFNLITTTVAPGNKTLSSFEARCGNFEITPLTYFQQQAPRYVVVINDYGQFPMFPIYTLFVLLSGICNCLLIATCTIQSIVFTTLL